MRYALLPLTALLAACTGSSVSPVTDQPVVDTGDTDTEDTGDTDGPNNDGWGLAHEVELRITDVRPPPLTLDLSKQEVAELFGPVAEDVLLVEVDSTPLLTNAMNTIKNACGTSWQANRSDPRHDCSVTTLGRTFTGPDGTWRTSDEYSLVRLLTMTPANSVVDGTSIEELRAVADFLGLGGGFAQILAESLQLGMTEEFLTTDVVVSSLQRNLLETHPEIGAGGRLPITLYDALNDLAPMSTRFGPTLSHPGVLDPSVPTFGEVMTPQFRMRVTAQSNLKVLDGIDLDVGKDYLSAIVDTTGPTYDDEAEFDFNDPAKFSITGMAANPTVDLRFQIFEHPSFVEACAGDNRCQANLPGSPVGASVWSTNPATLEYIVADAGLEKYGGLRNEVEYYFLVIFWAATVSIGQNGAPAGWASFDVLLDIGSPPGDQYTWELINEVAQEGLHHTPYADFAEGQANPAFTLEDIPVGLTGDEVADAVRPYLQGQASEISEYILGNYKENSGDVDLYFRRTSDGTPALFFIAEEDRIDGASYRWDHPGFYADEALTTKLSATDIPEHDSRTHEKWVVPHGESTVYVSGEDGLTRRIRIYAPASGDITEVTALVDVRLTP